VTNHQLGAPCWHTCEQCGLLREALLPRSAEAISAERPRTAVAFSDKPVVAG